MCRSLFLEWNGHYGIALGWGRRGSIFKAEVDVVAWRNRLQATAVSTVKRVCCCSQRRRCFKNTQYVYSCMVHRLYPDCEGYPRTMNCSLNFGILLTDSSLIGVIVGGTVLPTKDPPALGSQCDAPQVARVK